ncbi:MAG: lamin tail domain-containing protein [candidate division WOR-3 bacterium]|nr:lamin tail domain-containing protein [candidate division WOR-3 bacterium]
MTNMEVLFFNQKTGGVIMKKIKFLYIILVLGLTSFAMGQTVSEEWIIKATDVDAAAWQASGNARGVDVNINSTHTGKTVLYADHSGNGVHVHDAANGAYLWSLDTTGVGPVFTGHTVSPYRVAVTADGQVFVNSFDGIVVKWADDAASTVPSIVIDLSGETGNSRGLEVVGSGNSVRVFLGKGTDIRIFDDDGTGTFVEAVTRKIETGWTAECEAIACNDSNLVFAAKVASAQDQSVYRRVYELIGGQYVNDTTLVSNLPYLSWFMIQGLDVAGDYYVMTESAGGNDGFGIGTLDGQNYNPLSGDSDGDNVYDGGMNNPTLVSDICIDPETYHVYWTAPGADDCSGIGCLKPHPGPDLLFSEYIEGSSNNKALEIYNGSGEAIDLSEYRIAQSVNGGGWQYYHYFPNGATLADDDVWVILNSEASTDYFLPENADEVLSYPSVVHHNGDDARGLEKRVVFGTDTTWKLIDVIGIPDEDPGYGWDVAGVLEATKDHTLVRKSSVTSGNLDWVASAGTNADDSEWIVYDKNTFTCLGSHPYPFLETGANGDLDLSWDFNTAGGAGTMVVVDSSSSAWGSEVLLFTDEAYTGIAYIEDAMGTNLSVSADIYLIGPADPDAPLYTGLAVKADSAGLVYYRLVYRNSSSSDNGQIRLQGYDGAWQTVRKWNPGVDFDTLETGWHNLEARVVNNNFTVFLNGKMLPDCPIYVESPVIVNGFPGVFTYNTANGTVLFDNFVATEGVDPPLVDAGPDMNVETNTLVTLSGTIFNALPGNAITWTQVSGPAVVLSDSSELNATFIPTEGGVYVFKLEITAGPYYGHSDEVTITVGEPEELYTWWEKNAGDYTFFQSDNNTRGMDLNPVTGHLLVASRTEGNNIHVLEAENGTYLSSLDMTDVSGGIFPITLVSVANDGVIYGCNLTTTGAGFKFYRWGDESSTPTVAFEGDLDQRVGDSFTVIGSGANTIVYASGANVTKIYVFTTTDGISFSLFDEIPILSSLARGGIAPVADTLGSDIWVNCSGKQAALIDTGGTVITTIDTSMNTFFAHIDYMETGDGRKLIAVAGGNCGDVPACMRSEVWDVTNPSDPWRFAYGSLTNTPVANVNGTGIAILEEKEDGVLNLYHLLSNNGIALYSEEEFITVDVTFEVNMSYQITLGNFTADTDYVDVAGNFNNWGDSPIVLDDPDSDSIYSVTVSGFCPGDTIEYKFRINGNWDTSEFPFGGPNRVYVVPDTNSVVSHWYNDEEPPEGVSDNAAIPDVFSLHQNYPNPFNTATFIKYNLPKEAEVRILIYDLMGREIRALVNEKQNAGYKSVLWDGRDNNGHKVSSGLYIYRMITGEFQKTKKMILLK